MHVLAAHMPHQILHFEGGGDHRDLPRVELAMWVVVQPSHRQRASSGDRRMPDTARQPSIMTIGFTIVCCERTPFPVEFGLVEPGRNRKNRMALLEAGRAMNRAFSVRELHTAARDAAPRLALTTAYRTIDRWREEGWPRKRARAAVRPSTCCAPRRAPPSRRLRRLRRHRAARGLRARAGPRVGSHRRLRPARRGAGLAACAVPGLCRGR